VSRGDISSAAAVAEAILSDMLIDSPSPVSEGKAKAISKSKSTSTRSKGDARHHQKAIIRTVMSDQTLDIAEGCLQRLSSESETALYHK
jgi:hypothetical protein